MGKFQLDESVNNFLRKNARFVRSAWWIKHVFKIQKNKQAPDCGDAKKNRCVRDPWLLLYTFSFYLHLVGLDDNSEPIFCDRAIFHVNNMFVKKSNKIKSFENESKQIITVIFD